MPYTCTYIHFHLTFIPTFEGRYFTNLETEVEKPEAQITSEKHKLTVNNARVLGKIFVSQEHLLSHHFPTCQ